MNIRIRRKLRRTTYICCAFIGLMIGLFFAYYQAKPQPYWVFIVFLLPFLTTRFTGFKICLVILVSLLVGIWRGSATFTSLVRYQRLYGQSVFVQGVVADDSGYNSERNQTEFHIKSIVHSTTKLPGRIQVGTTEDPRVTRGDVVMVNGKLKSTKGTSRQGTVSFASVKIIRKNSSSLENFRSRFFKSVHNALPEPYGSLGLGYLVGLRVSIPKELSEQLAIVGLTHIIAVSGYNLTIIVQAVRRLFGRRSAYQSVVFSLLLVAGFMLVAGGSAPITRAAAVCVFSLFAWYYGRQLNPLLLLLLSGALTAFANPLYIWGDPGWYLSFLAFGGVLILAPLITARYFIKKPPGTILQILIETLCAQVCTIPYTLFLFGGVSLIAPIANIVVLPFIPFVMLAVFVLGLVGMAVPIVALYLGFMPTALLTLQVWLIEHLSHVPGAHVEVTISFITMGAMFILIIGLVAVLKQHVVREELQKFQELQDDLI